MSWQREIGVALLLLFALFLAETMLVELQALGLT